MDEYEYKLLVFEYYSNNIRIPNYSLTSFQFQTFRRRPFMAAHNFFHPLQSPKAVSTEWLFDEETQKQEPVLFSPHLDDLPECDSEAQPVLKRFLRSEDFGCFFLPCDDFSLQAAHIIKVPFTVFTRILYK